jgi:hypothetical protein
MSNDYNNGIDRITFMLKIEDNARADVAMTPDKTYYRFATTDSLEDGELPGMGDKFGTFAEQLLASFNAGVGTTASIEPVKFTLFVNNRIANPVILNNDTLRAFVNKLESAHDEFGFLSGFTY